MGELGPADGASCASCHAPLAGTSKFCPECGNPVAQQAAGPESRRTVTLVFTDVTGSTALGEQLDPETYRGIMGRYFDVARAAVERHGGTVEKFVGDAVLAVFGVPDVREDDALRAVRAAQDLHEAMVTLSADLERGIGVRLEVRTGVHTGPVVVGSARAGGSFATGDAVNIAARLEQAALPGTVLVGRPTYDLVRDAVEVEPVDPVVAKGKAEPLTAYRLLGVTDAVTGRTRRPHAVLVGRDRESRALDDALDRTLALGRSHLVTVLGAPGLGKTRLIDDFLTRVGDRALVAGGRCVSYGQGITYWPVVQVLRQALEIPGNESAEVTRQALVAAMGGTPTGAAVVDLLMPLLGLGGDPGETEQTLWAVGRLLEQLATTRPLVITIDDLHWAEPTLLDLLEQVRMEVADLPLLMVCQARPELLELHPHWGGGSVNSTMLGLEPFSNDQTRTSLTALLPGRLPDDLVDKVALWSGGNPLFVEEVVTHLRESGLLSLVDGAWQLSPAALPFGVGTHVHDLVPPTVAALLAARLGRLPEPERRLLEQMSVVGLEVAADEVAVLNEQDPATSAALVTALVRRDLLRRVRAGTGDRWQFRHVLVREAAYDALPKAVRATLHERFAAHVGSSTENDTGAERLAFVAHHREQAAHWQAELAPRSDDAVRAAIRAADALAEASGDARDRDDLTAGEGMLRRALELPSLPVARRRDLFAQLILSLAAPLPSAVDELLTAYADLLDETATELDHAFVTSRRLALRLAAADEEVDPAHARAAASELARLARTAGDRDRLVAGLLDVSRSTQIASRWAVSQDALDEILTSGRPGDRRMAEDRIGVVLLFGPAPLTQLRAYVETLLELPGRSPERRTSDQNLLTTALAAAGAPGARDQVESAARELLSAPVRDTLESRIDYVFASLAADLPHTAIAVIGSIVGVMRETGGQAYASSYLLWQAALMLELGHPPADVQPVVDEARSMTTRFDVLSCSTLLAVDAILAAHRGEHPLSADLAEQACRRIDTGDETWGQGDVRRWAALAAGVRGDTDEQRRLLTGAAVLYRAKGFDLLAHRLEAELRA